MCAAGVCGVTGIEIYVRSRCLWRNWNGDYVIVERENVAYS